MPEESNDRVCDKHPRVLDHLVDRVLPAVLEQLSVLSHRALAHRLESAPIVLMVPPPCSGARREHGIASIIRPPDARSHGHIATERDGRSMVLALLIRLTCIRR